MTTKNQQQKSADALSNVTYSELVAKMEETLQWWQANGGLDWQAKLLEHILTEED